MGALSAVTWFCSVLLISSSNFPFPSSLSSRAAAYLCTPAPVFVCLCSCVNFSPQSPLSLLKPPLPYACARVVPPPFFYSNTLPCTSVLSLPTLYSKVTPPLLFLKSPLPCTSVSSLPTLYSTVASPRLFLKSPLPQAYRPSPHCIL